MANNQHPTYQDEGYQYHVMYLPRGIERLQKLGSSRIYPKNTELASAGEIPKFCYVVKAGSLIAYEYTITGDQRIYNIMEPGSIFLEECLLFDKPCPVNFRTLTKCEVIQIEKCDLKRAFKHDIDVVMDICESLATKFLSTMEYQRFTPKQGSEWKICKMLIIFADHYGVPQKDGRLLLDRKISHQMLADILGMNRVTVSRKMKDLKEAGFFDVVNGYLCFPDLKTLEVHMQELTDEEKDAFSAS